jgi:hypothetical protein
MVNFEMVNPEKANGKFSKGNGFSHADYSLDLSRGIAFNVSSFHGVSASLVFPGTLFVF